MPPIVPLHHPLVLADAVLVVDDVVAGLEVLEERRRSARLRGRGWRCVRRRPVRSPSATIATFAAGTVNPRCSGATTTCPPGRVRSAPRRVAAIVKSRPRSRSSCASRCAEPSPSAATTTRYLSASSSREPVGEPLAVADDRPPSAGAAPSASRGAPASTVISHAPVAPPSSCSGSACRRGNATSGSRPHVLASARARSSSSASSSLGPVAHPPRFDEHHLAGAREDVGEQLIAVGEPRQPALHAVELGALGQPLPLLAAPRLVGDELLGRASRTDVAREQLAGREDARLGRGRRCCAGR